MEKVRSFVDLISRFINEEVAVDEFETKYIALHQNGEEITGSAGEALFWLFTEVDAYTNDEEAVREEPEYFINEDQLRESARKTLAELQDFPNS